MAFPVLYVYVHIVDLVYFCTVTIQTPSCFSFVQKFRFLQ
ncbi:hypothetical protein HMPREF9441_03309 [Paraprevotella clara YIT 11840]|uniref:Uncharacterized protein n=1 Tax=Paraprevotella clara YIT 11840 TaxID=762968 RepID=G5SVD5_9BACT|nr:hypothetical protein HMPREF9441_03309 [Paraprevotella clara YIT 11840]